MGGVRFTVPPLQFDGSKSVVVSVSYDVFSRRRIGCCRFTRIDLGVLWCSSGRGKRREYGDRPASSALLDAIVDLSVLQLFQGAGG